MMDYKSFTTYIYFSFGNERSEIEELSIKIPHNFYYLNMV